LVSWASARAAERLAARDFTRNDDVDHRAPGNQGGVAANQRHSEPLGQRSKPAVKVFYPGACRPP
jgi:hypothetical protein